MFPFERLEVWRRAHEVAVALHATTSSWRDWGLRSQMRRCAVSVAAIIAEGAGCESQPLFARYLAVAQASASELRYHLRFARDVGSLGDDEHAHLDAAVEEVRRMLTGLSRRVRATHDKGTSHRP